MILGNLGNMKQCIYTLLKLYKCTKVSHSCNLTGYYIANCKLGCCILPWILIFKLHAECNFGSGNILNKSLNHITGLKYLLRILNSSPGHLRNMKKSVCTTDINKYTKVCYVLNGSFNNVTNMDALKKLLLLLLLFSYKKLSAVTDITSSLRIVFADYKFNFLSCILG